ncbi:MAG: metalloregulator ArsR/SmtB family transcription factor [Patescibacteria group bacterium]
MKKTFKNGCPRCFRALSTDVRAKIIDLLASGTEHTVTDIVAHFRLTQPTISYHLSELEKTGLLTSRIDGRFVFYKLNLFCKEDKERCLLLR